MERDALIRRIGDRLRADDRVRAAWLSGSLGRGTADEYSDVDVWAVASPEDRDALAADWPELSASIAPTVLSRQVGNMPVFTAVTEEWLRFDLVVGTPEEVPTRTRTTLTLMFDKDGLDARLRESGEPRSPDPRRVSELVTEFFRVLGLLPVVLGREEYALAVSGGGLLRTMLIQLMLEDVAVEDRGGALHLASLLPPERMRAIDGLPPMSATRESAIAVNLAVAAEFLPLARDLTERTGGEWPLRLETACLAHLERSLGLVVPGGG